MRIVFYLNCVSAHQIPLAKEVAAIVGHDDFAYVDAGYVGQKFQSVDSVVDVRVMRLDAECRELLRCADVVYTGLRDLDLLEQRASRGLMTYYYSERWFKPIHGLTGLIRMLVPRYRKLVKRFVTWANSDEKARILAVGPWAKKDFLRMGVRADKIIPWGYFVQSAVGKRCRSRKVGEPLKVLWVGRDLAWKRVKDIECAVDLASKNLTTAAHQPSTPIIFTKLTGVTPAEVRAAMRSHDLYVLASDAEEGWGAALNEALEEGMNAVGTFEAGASAAILPKDRLYHAGDWRALAELIRKELLGDLPKCSIGNWTAKDAARRLLELIE